MPDHPETRPKRRDPVQTRAAILAAAQEAFSHESFAHVGIRDVAQKAGVSSSLIDHYFGSKAKLFEEALIGTMREGALYEGDRATFGKRFHERLMEPTLDTQLLSMCLLSAGDPEAGKIVERVTRELIIPPVAAWLGPPDAEARAGQMLILGGGFTVHTRIIRTQDINDPAVRRTAVWLARALQDIVDQSDPKT